MYNWYAQATLCIAYLSDIAGPWPSDQAEYVERTLALLPGSAWFTRGWTLQELIAPRWVLLFSAEWVMLGWKRPRSDPVTRDDPPNLIESLSEITGIDSSVLEIPTRHTDRSIAQKMSWASQRATTRPEDLAYSLLGLFSVNMPLLYGEGASKAFMRLQLEIIRRSTDESIFAWKWSLLTSWNGLLALSPEGFRGAGDIMSLCNEEIYQASDLKLSGPLADSRFLAGRPSYLMTNKGLEFRAPAWMIRTGSYNVYVVWLACARRSSDEGVQKHKMHTKRETLQQTSQCCVVLYARSEDDVNDRVRRAYQWYEHPDESLRTLYPPETWQDVGEKWFEIAQDGR
ncbi:hypothetical protein LTR15_003256 [Elasticomyces elasticus]|nr:hypothetical protein LTR15_003256 [Elasticomyces elasticus]